MASQVSRSSLYSAILQCERKHAILLNTGWLKDFVTLLPKCHKILLKPAVIKADFLIQILVLGPQKLLNAIRLY